jgi:hypothetical protein
MTVGMPGTGLGGLFYLVLALTMPVYELYLTVRGRSSPQRWRFVARQAAMALAILTALVLTAVATRRLLGTGGIAVGSHWLVAPAAIAAVVLATLTVTLWLWALAASRASARAH